MNTKHLISRLLAVFLIGGLAFSQMPSVQAASVSTDGFNPGANSEVLALAVQADGKILVGGLFTQLGGSTQNYLGRLNPDGTLDSSFASVVNGPVYALAVQSDGKILVGGNFIIGDGSPCDYIARLNSNGSQDICIGADAPVRTIVVQPDGKILVGGEFNNLSGVSHHRTGRLTSTGSSDSTFSAGTDGAVNALAFQLDGKVLIGGEFNNLDGISSQSYIGRINPTNSVDTSFRPLVGGPVEALALQADGKILVGGRFTSLDANVQNYIGRLNSNGTRDTSFQAGYEPNSTVYVMLVQPDGKILVGGSFTRLGTINRNYIARLNPDGTPDSSFNPGASADAGGLVHALAVQPDGKILVGGLFTQLAGSPRNYIGRLYPDGSLDTDLNPGAGDGAVNALALQADGKILVGGNFTTLGGVSRSYLGRLNPDGTLDSSFSPAMNGAVYALAIQPDGKILVAGDFTTLGIYNRVRVARLNVNGAVDTGFDPGSGANGTVYSMALQPDGKILVGGNFTSLNGSPHNYIGRLNSGGVPDSFNPGTNGVVYSLALQSNDKILVGGNFTSLNGSPHNYIGRLDQDGTLDSFNPGAGGVVYSLVLQPDGKILVGGSFTTLGAGGRNSIGRLDSGGTLDSFNPGVTGIVYSLALQPDGAILVGGSFTNLGGNTRSNIGQVSAAGILSAFNPGADNTVNALALQQDGKLLAGGNFTILGGNSRSHLGRLSIFTAVWQELSYDGSIITWSRSGGGPEVTHVDFESSTDGVDYIPVPGGITYNGTGWDSSSVSLNGGIYIRARGYFSSGNHDGSSSVVESPRYLYIETTPPVVSSITRASPDETNASSVAFTVTFSKPVTYVDPGDFILRPTNTVTTSPLASDSVTGSGTTYTVTVSGIAGNGELHLDLRNDHVIMDEFGNLLVAGFTAGDYYTIDSTKLTIMSIVRTSYNSITKGSSVDFTVTFSKPVTGVEAGDFELTLTPIPSGSLSADIAPVSPPVSPPTYLSSYTVTVNNITGNGTLRLDVKTSATICDVTPHCLGTTGFTGGESYTIDQTAPTVESVHRTAGSPNPTNADDVTFLVTFSEVVTGVVAADFLPSDGGASVGEISGIGSTRTVTVHTSSGGSLTLDVVASGNIADAALNKLTAGYTAGDSYTITKAIPPVVSIERASPNPTNGNSVNFIVTFQVSFNGGVVVGDFGRTTTGTASGSVTNVTDTGPVRTVTVSSVTGDGTLRLDETSYGGFTTGQSYTVDHTAPTVSAILRADPSPTDASSVRFTAIFSEPVTGVGSTDFTLTKTGGLTASSSFTVTPLDSAAYTVTISAISGSLYGTLRLDVNPSGTGIMDLAGNPISGGFTSGQVYTIDRIKARLYLPLIKK
jgi:uncharacterized delta-60 repeat protein